MSYSTCQIGPFVSYRHEHTGSRQACMHSWKQAGRCVSAVACTGTVRHLNKFQVRFQLVDLCCVSHDCVGRLWECACCIADISPSVLQSVGLCCPSAWLCVMPLCVGPFLPFGPVLVCPLPWLPLHDVCLSPPPPARYQS
jgi:hypothetical protein